MRALVVYESMYGNTHEIAERVGDGLRAAFDVTVVAVDDATDDRVRQTDLLVVGGPTHVHGLSSHKSRRTAVDTARKDPAVVLDPDAEGPGLRDWFHDLARGEGTMAAAFDTRFDAPATFTGRASKGIARRLRRHGFDVVADPESFLVDDENRLVGDERDRARRWGADLATTTARA